MLQEESSCQWFILDFYSGEDDNFLMVASPQLFTEDTNSHKWLTDSNAKQKTIGYPVIG